MARKRKMSRVQRIGFAIMIAFAVISFWRGLWGLLDYYLFPGNYKLSLWTSLLIGMIILIVTDYLSREFFV